MHIQAKIYWGFTTVLPLALLECLAMEYFLYGQRCNQNLKRSVMRKYSNYI